MTLTLIPLLMAGATSRGETPSSAKFSCITKESHQHCNMQLWLPGSDSEDMLYRDNLGHGLALTDVPITSTWEWEAPTAPIHSHSP